MWQFFAIVNERIRWELNDLARRSDKEMSEVELRQGTVLAPPYAGSAVAADGPMLDAIDGLQEESEKVSFWYGFRR